MPPIPRACSSSRPARTSTPLSWKPLPSAGMLEAVKQIDAASAKQGEVLANAQAKQVAANQKELETVEAHKVEMGAVRMTWNEKGGRGGRTPRA